MYYDIGLESKFRGEVGCVMLKKQLDPAGRLRRQPFLLICLLVPALTAVRADGPTPVAPEAESDPAAVEFFEKSVRPILAARCQGCHGPAKQKGGLRLDARAAMIAGGSTGPAVVPGNPKESLLVDAINYGETYQMPPKSKLPAEEIATLTEWVKRGVPWGVERDRLRRPGPPGQPGNPDKLSKEEFQNARSILVLSADRACDAPRREDRWPPGLGAQPDRSASSGGARGATGLRPRPRPTRRTLIRRLSFDLTGLAPRPEEVAAFLADRAPDAYERLVDRLLASPHYGERWARHWLDLVRYAETAGHEFDYDIANAFRYRDYVIRAFNADLPYNRFVTEQIAGDLLESPRRHPAEGFNESILGTGFYFLGEGTHSPVDVREEQMRRIDNQIDVISKTFLGLTVACARCHDHKFDPITNKTITPWPASSAARGISRPSSIVPSGSALDGERLRELKKTIAAVCATRRHVAEPSAARCDQTPSMAGPAACRSPKRANASEIVFEDFNRDSFDGWFVTGDAFGDRPSRPGDLRLELASGTPRLVAVKPGQAHSGLISDRLRGVLRSRTLHDRDALHSLAGRGAGRQDQRRRRRLREDPRSDLRRP